MIYNAYINTYSIYLNPIWSGAAQFKLNDLYVLQNRALKQILNVKLN